MGTEVKKEVQSEFQKLVKGIQVGVTDNNKLIYNIVGEMSELEFFGIVKFLETRVSSSMEILSPNGNNAIIKSINDLAKALKEVLTTKQGIGENQPIAL